MTPPQVDDRSPERRAQDEQIAAEPPMAALDIAPGTTVSPMEAHLFQRTGRAVAVAGVVENGLVRPLDPTVKLAEHSRVIIVATEAA
jgi:hypothetical protein